MLVLKGAFPIEDGAIHGPRGKYYLPVFGGGGKTLTKGGTIALVSAVLAVIVLILATANYFSKDNTLTPIDYEHFLGMTRAAVAEKLEIEQEDMQYVSNGAYRLPHTITIAGINYPVMLHFEEQEGLLNGYSLSVAYSADNESAADNVQNLLKALGYGGITVDDVSFDQPVQITRSWDLTPGERYYNSVRTYLDHLNESEHWEGRVAGLLAVPAHWYRDLDINYDPETNELSVVLKFSAQPRRSGVLDH